LRTVFLGTSEFAAAVLERLAGGPHRPALVLTRPDRPSGRGRKLTTPPVAETARRLGLPVEQPQRVNDPETRAAIELAGRSAGAPVVQSLDGQVLIVCAFGALIREPLLSAWPLLNVHPSLLPRWRGAAPIERAIIAGDTETGVSIMRLTAGLDSGPVCRAAVEPIHSGDTYGSLAARLWELGGELLVEVLDGWARGVPPEFAAQDESRATYAEKLGPADRLLDPARPALELERRVRALAPHVGARLPLAQGTMLGVRRARALPGGYPSGALSAGSAPRAQPSTSPAPGAASPVDLAPGALAGVDGRLLYGTRAGALELLEVQPPGGRAMDAASYLRGHELPGP
jgi:methionyl-tRNA formyltransferase